MRIKDHKGEIAYIGVIIATLGLTLGGTRGCNNHFNNREIKAQNYSLYSHARGLSGHEELVRYTDGSQEAKIYSNLGHRMWGSKLFEDKDGDSLVDKIRIQGSELKMNRPIILIRESDYLTNKEDFDKADAKLEELNQRYPVEE